MKLSGTFATLSLLAGLITLPGHSATMQFSAWSDPVNLGPVVNSPASDFAPHLSGNGLSLFFASTRPGGLGGEDLWVAQRATVNDPWSTPVNLGAMINTDSGERSPGLSDDGRFLFFASTRPGGLGGADIWVSERSDPLDDFGWQAPVNLGSPINTAAVDVGPNYFKDSLTGAAFLYLVSNRPGGPGALDIYVSEIAADGSFGPPMLIDELATPMGDITAHVRRDGLELLFASNRTGVFGLWVSTRDSVGDPWGAPVNLGPVVNTGSETFPALSSDGLRLFFNSSRPGGLGEADLYMSTRVVVPEPGALISGTAGLFLLGLVLVAQHNLQRSALLMRDKDKLVGHALCACPGQAQSACPTILRGAARNKGLVAQSSVAANGRAGRKPGGSQGRLPHSVLAGLLLAVIAKTASADTVTDWNSIMLATVNGQSPQIQARFAAIAQLAVFEAVNAIARDYKPYLGMIAAAPDASMDAAAIAAAHNVLRTYHPGRAMSLDADRLQSLATIPDSLAKRNGIAAGEAAAAAMIALRANDGSSPTIPYTPPVGPGFWQPVPPAFAPATFLHWARMTPFGVPNVEQFRSPPPPALTSNEYRRDYNEVKAVGGVNSSARPQDRIDVVRYASMTNPVQLWNRVAQQVSDAQGKSLLENARMFALLNMAICDTSIANMDSKYSYHFWRPATAIRAGDTDGNPRTDPDPNFTPFISTPTYPAYPSSHGSQSNAARYVLERIFGKGRHSITLSNEALPGVTLRYTKFQQITDDIDDARVYGGIHFRFDQEEATLLGRRVADYIHDHNLQCARQQGCD